MNSATRYAEALTLVALGPHPVVVSRDVERVPRRPMGAHCWPRIMSESETRSFFERERERLVLDITNQIETIITSTNAVNRKLEEHVSVGKGFESISALWGQFSELAKMDTQPDMNESTEPDAPMSPK